jgi:endonuclease/exonuclease/phosphatase (EEP) superfamily protein YafD
MRLVAWNCNMALHRKCDALLSLDPDVAVISECAEPERLRRLSKSDWLDAEPVWIGRSETKGLAVLGFNGYRVRLATARPPELRYVAPVRVRGPTDFNLLAVWAQNASAGVTRKHQHGPLRRALRRYRAFLSDGPTVIAGDFNSNSIWDRPGWRNNHSALVERLRAMGLVSAYHAVTGEAQGRETTPTLYWRDRRRDGPTYHIDYIFVPEVWRASLREVSVGGFEDWCGSGLSDHVPVVIDVRMQG